ncbi:hypothetical protein GCM10023201_52260 [Actinomycetospora corticicola]
MSCSTDVSTIPVRTILPGCGDLGGRADPGALGSERCDPTAVRGLCVVPPGESAAAYVPRAGTACAADVVTLRVRAIRSDVD